ncbi:hypothetical protein BDV12DRAFT_174876 [Aspergillus spectabilis]
MTRTTTPPDCYEILNLPFPQTSTPYSKQQVKIAYHKALLRHHPDKTPNASASPDSKSTTTTPPPPSSQPTHPFTIDEITTAYKTLSNPSLRAEYDRALRLDRDRVTGAGKNGTVFHTGLEVVDLEDLECDEDANTGEGDVWYRGCRCGDERGFCVSEGDLEREAENGEVVVGCRGCSLYMKVLFAVQEDDEDGDAGGKT